MDPLTLMQMSQRPGINPLEEMPRGTNLRQMLMQRQMMGFNGMPQSAPQTQVQGQIHDIENRLTKNQGDILKEMKHQLKQEEEQRKADRQNQDAEYEQRHKKLLWQKEDKTNKYNDEVLEAADKRIDADLNGETAHAIAVDAHHQQLLVKNQKEVELAEVRRRIQRATDQGITTEYAHQIEMLEQELLNAQGDLEMLYGYMDKDSKTLAITDATRKYVADSKMVATQMKATLEYIKTLTDQLRELREKKGNYDAIKLSFGSDTLVARGKTLEAIKTASDNIDANITNKRKQMQSVRDMESEIIDKNIEKSRLDGELENLEKETALVNDKGAPTDFGKRYSDAMKQNAQLNMEIRERKHDVVLNEADMKNVQALELENVEKAKARDTLNQENEQLKGYVEGTSFIQKRKDTITNKANLNVKLEQGSATRQGYTNRMARKTQLEAEYEKLNDVYIMQTATNDSLKGIVEGQQFKATVEKARNDIIKSKTDMATAKRRHDQLMAIIRDADNLQSSVENEKQKIDTQKAINDALQTHITSTEFTNKEASNRAELITLYQKIENEKDKKSEFERKRTQQRTLMNTLSDQQDEHDRMKALNDKLVSTQYDTTIVTQVGEQQALIEAENRRTHQLKEWRASEDKLIQIQAQNEAMNSSEIEETIAKTTDVMAKHGQLEVQAKAEKEYHDSLIAFNQKRSTEEAQKLVRDNMDDVRSLNDGAAILAAVDHEMESNKAARDANDVRLSNFQTSKSQAWACILQQYERNENKVFKNDWPAMDVGTQRQFLQMCTDFVGGNRSEADAYADSFGVDITGIPTDDE